MRTDAHTILRAAFGAPSIPTKPPFRGAIDNFIPPIQQVIVQQNYLERSFETMLKPNLRYDRICTIDPQEANVGESKTLTRPAILPPVVNDATPTAVGTDLNKGMTDQSATYEQYVVFIGKLHGKMSLSTEMDYTKIKSEYMLNWDRLAGQAGTSLDTRAALRVFQAYDSGNTFALSPNVGATVEVDNINGFLTQYTFVGGVANGVPVGVNAGNKLPVLVYAAATPLAPPVAVNVIAATPDNGTGGAGNGSTAYVGGIAYGQSGTLTFDAVVAIAAGDTIRSVDASVVIRPNGKMNRSQLLGTDTVAFSAFRKASAKMKNRQVPTLPNGLYPCFIDAEMLSDLGDDQAFQRATATQFGKTPYFETGIIAGAFGLEFVETTTNPVYPIGNGIVARHAVVLGRDAIIKVPFKGSLQAARDAQQRNNSIHDIKITRDGIVLITRNPIDVEADEITQTWRFSGGHVCATDITSTPAAIATTDNARYKRGVMIEAASPA
jgi:hypothetical protein